MSDSTNTINIDVYTWVDELNMHYLRAIKFADYVSFKTKISFKPTFSNQVSYILMGGDYMLIRSVETNGWDVLSVKNGISKLLFKSDSMCEMVNKLNLFIDSGVDVNMVSDDELEN